MRSSMAERWVDYSVRAANYSRFDSRCGKGLVYGVHAAS